MKINEINAPKQLTEGPMLAAIKGALTGQGQRNTLAQQIFIKDFVQDAITSLNNGIKGGWVDQNLKTEPKSGPAPETPPSSPAAPSAPSPAAPSAPTPPSPATPATPTPMSKTATSGPTSAQSTVAAARQFNKSVATAQSAKADERKSNEELKAAAQAAMSKPAFQQTATDKVNIQKAKQAGLVKENQYQKLNSLFESIIAEAAQAIGISEYLMDWFEQYMAGVNWRKAEQKVKEKLDKIEQEYPKNLKNNITELGHMAFALSKAGSSTPAGAPPQLKAKPASSGKKLSPEELAAQYAEMKPSDQRKYDEIMKKAKYG